MLVTVLNPSLPPALDDEHRRRLTWLASLTGRTVAWSELAAATPRVVTQAKGIYKPEGSPYTVSVRETLSSPYADRPPLTRPDGTWLYLYHEETAPDGSNALFTNDGLRACMRDGVPVGVLRQTKGKPGAQYVVDGLARVVAYEDGFFLLARSGNGDPADLSLELGEHALGTAEAQAAEEIDPSGIMDARVRVMASIVRRRGQAAFRQQLLGAYRGACAVSGCQAEAVLEAAHIIPYMGADTNRVANGLLLRADLHTLFDLGLLTVDPATRALIVASALAGTEYAELSGRKLRAPTVLADHPSEAALQHHYARARAATDLLPERQAAPGSI